MVEGVDINGAVDHFPSLSKIGGWVRAPGGGGDSIIVRLYLDKNLISECNTRQYRRDFRENVGFLIDFPEYISITLGDLRSGRACVRASLAARPDAETDLPVWANITDPALLIKATNIDQQFLAFLAKSGLNLSFGAKQYPLWGTAFEAPVVLQSTEFGGVCSFGAFSGIYGRGRGVIYDCDIGRYCSIADGYTIGLREHPIDFLSSSMFFYIDNVHDWSEFLRSKGEEISFQKSFFESNARVKIGNDVWIGANVTIRRGVSIGDGAIVGAGSVVTKDVAPYAIVGGVPAKLIRYRFNESTIARLNAIKWWNYKIYAINSLNFSNIIECLDILEEKISSGSVDAMESGHVSLLDMKLKFQNIR